MAASAEDQQPQKDQFPLDPSSYQVISEIGAGVNAVVYKAVVLPMNHRIVAIKSINLERSRTDIDQIRQESKTLSLLSHPNVLSSHRSFIRGDCLWVVMPFMGGGSLQSIISHSFSDGLPEAVIAAVLKETLKALVYLHSNGHVHRDIKAGNILIDSDGTVKLADFGVSASIYEPCPASLQRTSSSSSSSALRLTDFAGTPYWMAPEVIHSHSGYSFKADIWSFGITALELAHGRPPLSNIPPSKSLILKITNRYRFSDFEKHRTSCNNMKFSKPFKDMVASCLNQDPSKRPTAEKLLKHPFFKNAKSSVLVRNLFQGLPTVDQRYRESKSRQTHSSEEDDEGDSLRQNDKQRRVSGWNFNEEGLELDPVFRCESESDETRRTYVRLGSDLFIQQPGESFGLGDGAETPGKASTTSTASGGAASAAENQSYLLEQAMAQDRLVDQAVAQEIMLPSLKRLKESLEEQLKQVKTLINMAHGEEVEVADPLREMMMEMNRMTRRLEEEKEKTTMLQIEMEVLKLNISSGRLVNICE